MKTTNSKALLFATFSFLFPFTAAIADDASDSSPQFSVGLKAWNATWGTALPTLYTVATPAGTIHVSESLDSAEGSSKTSAYPSFAVKKDRFLVSASFARFSNDFLSPNTSVIAPNGMNVSTSRSDHIKRRESDFTAGYYVMPNIVVSLGYKHATEDRTSTLSLGGGTVPLLKNRARGLLLGAAANFSIMDRLSLSNQIAYGPARIKVSLADQSFPDDTVSARYMIYEIGLNYALPTGIGRGTAIGLGYRSQLVRTDSAGPANMNGRRYRDAREGFLLSMTIAI
ncbi:hypothetical protein [Pseudoduganella sp. OTU4001]|uniref:hypothetical protein n=1 Tax=Pseudoduganella sp. OTU4001 TaxID=3043854 RepID=UPI00313D4D11